MSQEDEVGIVDLASNNQDLKNNIAVIFAKLETMELSEIEEKVSVLMTNMINFFAQQIEEIPSFDLLTPEQQKIFLQKFKKVALNLKNKKIKTVDEMLQTFVFTVLSNLGEKTQTIEENEIIHNKYKQDFRIFLRHAANEEIDNIAQETETLKNNDFIYKSVLLDVKKTLQDIGLKLSSENIDKKKASILEEDHKKLNQYNLLKKGK
jgi:hypothetical protein